MTSYWCKKLHWSPFLHSPRSQCLHTTIFSPWLCRKGQSFPGDTREPRWRGARLPTAWTQLSPGRNSPGESGAQTPHCPPSIPSPDPWWRLESEARTRRTRCSPNRRLLAQPHLCPNSPLCLACPRPSQTPGSPRGQGSSPVPHDPLSSRLMVGPLPESRAVVPVRGTQCSRRARENQALGKLPKRFCVLSPET